MSCVVCKKATDNTTTCIECKEPFCTSCLKQRKKGRCPAHAKPAAGGGGGGGGSVDFASNDFDKEDRLIRASDGYSYFVADLEEDGSGEVPGNNPRTKKIMGSIQQNYNPESYGEDDLNEHYQMVLKEFRCHGDNTKEGSHCEKCGLEILKPDWSGDNIYGEVSDDESS